MCTTVAKTSLSTKPILEMLDESIPENIKDFFKEKRPKDAFVILMRDYHLGDKIDKEHATTIAIWRLSAFIIQIINTKYGTYKENHFEDLVSAAITGVLIGLERYNPIKSAPTTFFREYIEGEIKACITEEISGTTKHYASAIKKIKKAEEEFENAGTKYTDNDIAIKTGLALETVKNARIEMKAMEATHIESYESSDLPAELGMPSTASAEDVAYEEIFQRGVTVILDEKLTENERLALELAKGSSEELTHRQVANKMGISADEAQRLISTAIRKIENSKELRELYDSRYAQQYVSARASKPSIYKPTRIPKEYKPKFLTSLKDIAFFMD